MLGERISTEGHMHLHCGIRFVPHTTIRPVTSLVVRLNIML